MLRELTRILLSLAGVLAAFFTSPDSENFAFVQLGIVLIMLIVVALLVWCIPGLFRRHNKF